LAGASTCLVPFLNRFELLIAYAVVFGTCIAAFIALRSVVFAELLGINRLNNSFGLTSLFQGTAIVFGSPLSGYLLDATGSFTLPFLVCGTVICLGGIICLPAHYIERWEDPTGKYKKRKTEENV